MQQNKKGARKTGKKGKRPTPLKAPAVAPLPPPLSGKVSRQKQPVGFQPLTRLKSFFGTATQTVGVSDVTNFVVNSGGNFRVELDSAGQVILYNNTTGTPDVPGGITTILNAAGTLFAPCASAAANGGYSSWYRLVGARLRIRCASSIQEAAGLVYSYRHPCGVNVPLRTIRDFGICTDKGPLEPSSVAWLPAAEQCVQFVQYNGGVNFAHPTTVIGFQGVNSAGLTFILDYELSGECIAPAMTDVLKPSSGGFGDAVSGFASVVGGGLHKVADFFKPALTYVGNAALVRSVYNAGSAAVPAMLTAA